MATRRSRTRASGSEPKLETQLGGSQSAHWAATNVEVVSGTTLTSGTGDLEMFGSSDYLGLAGHPAVRTAMKEAVDQFGAGLPIGTSLYTTRLHVELEEELADFLGVQMVALFSSGAVANLAAIGEIGSDRSLYMDARAHRTLLAAARASGSKVDFFRTGPGLPLAGYEGEPMLIASDGLFAISGELIDLQSLSASVEGLKDVLTLVDDAHALGTVGAAGRGTLGRSGSDCVSLISGSFSKVLGGAGGGFLAGPRGLIENVAQRSPYSWATNRPSPAVVSSALSALRILRGHPELVSDLEEATARLRATLTRHEIEFTAPPTPITPVRVGSTPRARKVSADLIRAGFFVPAITPPVVEEGQACLRLQTSVLHRDETVEFLAGAMAAALAARAN